MNFAVEKVEFFVFIGLAIWLVFYQFGGSRRPPQAPGEGDQKPSD